MPEGFFPTITVNGEVHKQMFGQPRIVIPPIEETERRGSLNKASHAPPKARMCFNSCLGAPVASGFLSNQRPVLSYQPSLDLVDNPHFGVWLADNFVTQNMRYYQRPTYSDGSTALPSLLNKPMTSGFHQVSAVCHTEPIVDQTEYQRVFVPRRLPPVSRHMNMGPKLETGCTEGEDLQYITFRDKNHATVVPHLIRKTVMTNDYLSPTFKQGKERLPGICSCSSRETGYTGGANTLLVDPRLHLPPLEVKSRVPLVKATGNREPSGFCLNMPNEIFSKGPLDPIHFTTHYNNNFRQKDRHTFYTSSIVNASQTKDNGYNKRNTDRFILKH
ncbi:protein phosphatase 1 regulatory subunit 32 [Poecilia latipinna]|uniref:protein phosphatase 1 regulatory subunit 32-like n=1 Tax=Poecilia latipinna TaxID=48699 RepID=UPI00072DC82F|nr:PREDICTED: protein phosphatase 1 regulatory subunit 32-like [Poecilia latipinna]XP_014877362.1 PREDICTED: protein phosphatase 1 regulatory subunit 32-like [Poecilia latipinna]XP_014901694.1 PREDICTED: protein phosphatase 1 regulatory subunit 32-like [Poecilia latipinna]XP_014901696.1 PREDICTED: protein phosphatase 1 regulatory subunit 32-like [Poecilia latipinna]